MAGQLELFDSPLQGKVRGERHIMEFPFFDLSKRARRKRLIFYDQERGVTIEIKAIEGAGIATIYDKDMILYVASLIVQDLAKGGEFRREYRFSAHDFFRVAGRDRSKRSYANLEQTIERLKGTLIKTNIETGGQGFDGWFNWFDSGTALHYERDPSTGEKRLKMIRVVLCEWLFRAILRDGKMLEYCDEYFDLKPIERRLYDLARIHCDDELVWTIELGSLKDLVGSDSEISKFRAQVAAISKARRLPDHEISLTDAHGSPLPSRAFPGGVASAREGRFQSQAAGVCPRRRRQPGGAGGCVAAVGSGRGDGQIEMAGRRGTEARERRWSGTRLAATRHHIRLRRKVLLALGTRSGWQKEKRP